MTSTLLFWEIEDKSTSYDDPDSKLVRTRWVVCNKGDAAAPDVRARLVACDINTFKTDDYFASTPPLESKRMLFSEFATRRTNATGKPLELSVVDI